MESLIPIGCAFSANGKTFLHTCREGVQGWHLNCDHSLDNIDDAKSHSLVKCPFQDITPIHICEPFINKKKRVEENSKSDCIDEHEENNLQKTEVEQIRSKRVASMAIIGDSPLIAIVFDEIVYNATIDDKYTRVRQTPADDEEENANSSECCANTTLNDNKDHKNERCYHVNKYVHNSLQQDGQIIQRQSVSETTRQQVLFYNAITQEYLAELYFRGAKVQSLVANNYILLVAMIDCFHLVDVRTLRHIRQQYMYKPTNPLSIIALSQVSEMLNDKVQSAADKHCKLKINNERLNDNENLENNASWMFRVAFPHNTQSNGLHGITILTVNLQEQYSEQQQKEREKINKIDEHKKNANKDKKTNMSEEKYGEDTSQPTMLQMTFDEIQIDNAHHHQVHTICLDTKGTFLASASECGSTIKLFDARDGVLLRSYLRGRMKAEIYALALSTTGRRLCALSSNGTLHVFSAQSITLEQTIKEYRKHNEELNNCNKAVNKQKGAELFTTQNNQNGKGKVLQHIKENLKLKNVADKLEKDKSCEKQRAVSKQPVYISQAMLDVIGRQGLNTNFKMKMPQPKFGWQYKLQMSEDETTIWLAMSWPIPLI